MSRHKPSATSGIEPNLPITPMLDMSFQLLMYFIINFNPADLEGQMDLALPLDPVSPAKKEPDPKAAPAKDDTLEIPADLTVVVGTQLDGANVGLASSFQLQSRSGDRNIGNFSDLKKELTDAREKAQNKEAIKLQAHGKLKWSEAIKVMDTIRDAGFNNISFVAPPDFMQAR
jgi:biopolymer transport protein ExbD